ncbi:glycerate kinase [Acidovorax sp.]|uniref:glycerate kinase type-2 family protein n=1 Tax=Acidovorax sp. TaxID=1872122 RepID=UPI0025C01734|nr:glycerate kinase [Acidovorax sp.]
MKTPTDTQAREWLRGMFDAAIASAQPAVCLPPHLPTPPRGRTVVIGAGKASAQMAQVLEAHWPAPVTGLVVTRYGHAAACQHIRVLEAAHPVPDAAGMAAAQQMMALVAGLTPDDLVIGLWSGGGSALLPLPLPGITLAEKQALHQALLHSGASIGEMNCVRRHLSAIKGGRLALACSPARVVNLVMSDVPGDDPLDVASGPTVADPTTLAQALAIVQRYGIALPPAVQAALDTPASESIKPGDQRLGPIATHVIATPRRALEAAAEVARRAGLEPTILGDALEGEAREMGTVLAGMARYTASTPSARHRVLLSGGESTVTLRSTAPGRGGRNVECLLSLALSLKGLPGVYALAGDTDGIDGLEPVAGAIATPDTLERAAAQGLQTTAALDTHDAHRFFGALGDSVVTGPTGTNVNDFRAVLITAPG